MANHPKSFRSAVSAKSVCVKFDPLSAGQALVYGLRYLKERLQWSGNKIARISLSSCHPE